MLTACLSEACSWCRCLAVVVMVEGGGLSSDVLRVCVCVCVCVRVRVCVCVCYYYYYS